MNQIHQFLTSPSVSVSLWLPPLVTVSLLGLLSGIFVLTDSGFDFDRRPPLTAAQLLRPPTITRRVLSAMASAFGATATGPGPSIPSTPVDGIPQHPSWARAQNAERFHLLMTYRLWKGVQEMKEAVAVNIDGHHLDISTVVAVAKHGCKPFIDDTEELRIRMRRSEMVLENRLMWGDHIYGVNTGFGGSANTRTTAFLTLQQALTQHQQSAILSKSDLSPNGDTDGEQTRQSMPTSWVRGAMLVRINTTIRGHSALRLQVVDTLAEMVRQDMIPIVPLRGSISASGDLMPLAYIAGALQGNPDIYVRWGNAKDQDRKIMPAPTALAEIQRINMEDFGRLQNRLARDEDGDDKGIDSSSGNGHGAADTKGPETGKGLADTKPTETGAEPAESNKSKKPRKRIRNKDKGKGKAEEEIPNVTADATANATANDSAWTEKEKRQFLNFEYRREYPFAPITLGPKEGLALVNGTAPSASVAALALYETNQLVVLAQLITCLSSEGLEGNVEWAHPFIAQLRPHRGQMEAARNMRYFLRGSKLVTGLTRPDEGPREGLIQDRYSTRSSPQWLAPIIEDLWISCNQLGVELNSTTDNPVVNPETDEIFCGANFQATMVSVMMEKTRLHLQMVGKLLFSQATELINPAYSKGLPPNLAPDDPSLSFCMKGVDINMAAYQSELEVLANPVTTHVQSAEMHNQSLNSLALISARYTMQSVETLSMMTAAAIYVGLQAVDLRVLHGAYMAVYSERIAAMLTKKWGKSMLAENKKLFLDVFDSVIPTAWFANASYDLEERCEKVVSSVMEALLNKMFDLAMKATGQERLEVFIGLDHLRHALHETLVSVFDQERTKFFADPARATLPRLGQGTKTLYQFVRGELGVPFHRGVADDPLIEPSPDNQDRPRKTVGSWISVIYEAIRDGRLAGHILASMKDDIEPAPLNVSANFDFETMVRETLEKVLKEQDVAPASDIVPGPSLQAVPAQAARGTARADRRKV